MGSDRAAGEMAVMGGEASEAPGAVVGGRGRCYRHVRPAAWVFECRVDDCGSGQLEQPPGDHYEGQFEGQNGAGEGLSGLVPARVS